MKVVIGVVVVLLASAPAGADTLTATRAQDLRETAHRVDITVRKGIATYVVRRTFHNRGRRADEARLDITLPHGAVATGLRIKAGSKWYTGELMHARKAEQLYRKLTGLGPSEPKDPALLYWQWTGRLGLRVFPIFPGKKSTVEYTLTVPAGYADGDYHVSYGRKPDNAKLATPVVRIRGRGIKRVTLAGRTVGRNWIPLRRIKRHPVLQRLGMSGTRVLVRTLTMPDVPGAKRGSVTVDIAHSWRGDVEITLVDPSDRKHQLRSYDLSDSDNDLRKTFEFSHSGPTRGAWHLLIEDHHPLDPGTLKSWSLALGKRKRTDRRPRPIPQPQADNSALATLRLTPTRARPTSVRLGRVDLLRDKQFVNLEIDVAKRLSKLPRALSVVFVVDASHTMGSEGIAAQLRLARSYLSHVPRARFALVGYGHVAESWTRGFVSARKYDATVAALRKTGRLAPRNGSFLDRGVALARQLLASQRRRQHAVIAMTDNRLRPVWNNGLATTHIGKLDPKAVVHVVEIDGGSQSTLEFERNDKHALFPLAKLRGGVAIDSAGVGSARWVPLVREALYLLRPNRLDNVRIPELSKYSVLPDGSTSLPEGTAVRWMDRVTSAPTRVTLHGELWSTKTQLRSRSDEPLNRAAAGYVFSHDLYDDLSESEQYVIASYGRAVSPVTSYLAIEPGVRPSFIGLAHGSSIGTGSGRVAGPRVAAGRRYTPYSWKAIVARIEKTCADRGRALTLVDVATQNHEIADVIPKVSPPGKFARCVVDQLWAVQLPSAYFANYANLSHRLRFE